MRRLFNIKQVKWLRRLVLSSCSLLAFGSAPVFAQAVSKSAAVTPMYGNIGAFYGNIGAFYGNIGAFYGNIGAFYGNIGAFYGPLSPFYGNISAFSGQTDPFSPATDSDLKAFYGSNYDAFWGGGKNSPYTNNPSKYINYSQIKGFWQTESGNWMAVQNAWATAQTSADYANVANLLQTTVLNPASSFWASAAMKATKTKDFGAAVSNAALQNAGIGLVNGAIDPTTLAAISPSQQAMFFLNFYDALMSYSGTPHVDWWMGATGWSPALAAQVGTGASGASPLTVGMLDFTVSNNQKNAQGSLLHMGSNVFSNGHGAAVGSLIMGSTDGTGIMGVLPQGDGNVIVYDPYDATNTTNWTQIGIGIQTLATATFSKKGAPTGVINASLGVPGWTLNPGWNDALSSGAALNHILVVAAGNDGSTQTANVPWNFAINPTLLIVGSAGVNGTISNFSNQPGDACLLDTSASQTSCSEANKLKYRFLVAPGELILVSDNMGNISRQTGTSLSAPLVSGTVALLQTRWPWLSNYANETAQVILQSATPKGTNPGADAVYGAGELNIAAAMAPLHWNNLQYYPVTKGGVPSITPVPISIVVQQVSTGTQATWNASGLYFTAIETIGRTFRDFEIPLSSAFVGQNVSTFGGSQLFQSYLTTNLKSWVASGAQLADFSPGQLSLGLSGFGASVGRLMGMGVRLNMAPSEVTPGYRAGAAPVDAELDLAGQTQAFKFGFGSGAAALSGETGLGERADYQPERGGANPFLGLASGGIFADGRIAITKHLAISMGVTQRNENRNLRMFGVDDQNSPVGVYAASAEHLGLDYSLTDDLVIHGALTHLDEDTGLLGVQSLDRSALRNGSSTNAATIGFDVSLPAKFTLSASGTAGNTSTASGQSLTTGSGGLISTAAEVALNKAEIFSENDRFRFTVSKPLQVNGGTIHYTSYGVVDRETGALGLVTEATQPAATKMPVSFEMRYGLLMPQNSAEFSIFAWTGNAALASTAQNSLDLVVGAKYRFTF